ncbi:MAG: LamG-like jellyroll fold domain-containing protein [bacterium]
MWSYRSPFVTSAIFSGLVLTTFAANPYSWQEPHATVKPTGDLEWAPRPFVFEQGASVRYVDFEAGDDTRAGTTKDQAWKHHPWDQNAAAQAKAAAGVDTYVFKRGTIYRGALSVPPGTAGTPGTPVRLTSDPQWGGGEAALYGSEAVTGWRQGGHENMPERDKVWVADLPFAPRLVCMVDPTGSVTRLKLARTPNWDGASQDNILKDCWRWENPDWWRPGNKYRVTIGKTKANLGADTKNLTADASHYEGATVWSEWGIVMGAPYATRVEAFDPVKKAIAFQGPWLGDSGDGLKTGHRYWLEDKPHYLDQPGEFWFDKQGTGGRLYVRLPGDADPRTVTIEAARHRTLIDGTEMSHITISGLAFRFGNLLWDLGARPFAGDVDTAGFRMVGSGSDIVIRNCTFEYMAKGIRIKVRGAKDRIDNVTILDNAIAHTDHGGLEVADGTGWGQKSKPGSLGNLSILRNHLEDIGFRPLRPNGQMALAVEYPEVAEIAGNVVERCGGSGLFIFGGKASEAGYEVPLSRILIHHNKVVDSLMMANDWGGIETWQGGPFYVFDNVSRNPVGMMNWGGRTFGHAYYLDGAFKNYHFNNIAWGKNNALAGDPKATANTSAFQEIISYQNTFFHNTAFRFQQGSRRQAPQAGRNKYLANVFENISQMVFRHSDKEGVDPNTRDAGQKVEAFDYSTMAYANNVLFDITGKVAVFESQGGDYADVTAFSRALATNGAMSSTAGILADTPLLRDPAKLDFRPVGNSAVAGRGVRVFVPWGLYAMVGEWNFTCNEKDPALVVDEHWFMTSQFGHRDAYYKAPTFPLIGKNVGKEDYVDGPLEDWTRGALHLNGRDQYLTLKNAPVKVDRVDPSMDFDPQIADSSFLIEAYFRTGPEAHGVLVEKLAGSGYSLVINEQGKADLTLRYNSDARNLVTRTRLNDGQWHHLIVEADHATGMLKAYVDGKEDAAAAGSALQGSLANSADLHVGGTPSGRHLAVTLDFLRMARGTLADARTTIGELYAWQFAGPQFQDFCGTPRTGKGAAGAILMGPGAR